MILQQSGIGPQSVLQNAGVPQRVDLPVGLNLIDQTTVTTNWGFKNARGGGQPITFPRFQVCHFHFRFARFTLGDSLVIVCND